MTFDIYKPIDDLFPIGLFLDVIVSSLILHTMVGVDLVLVRCSFGTHRVRVG